MEAYQNFIETLNNVAHPLNGHADQYANLLEKIGNARFVLLGEASHGTDEFYRARMETSQQLYKFQSDRIF